MTSGIVLHVSSAPIQSDTIQASTQSGSTPLIIDFESINKNNDIIHQWEFSDGTKLFWTKVTHIFTLPGTYDVTLTQIDANKNTSNETIEITALDQPNCEADYDSDGFNNCEDICPLIPWGNLNKWCPLLEEKCDTNCGCKQWYTCNFNGDQKTCESEWVCLPNKPKSSCYYQAEKNYIFWNAICNSCPCTNKLEYNATIRLCDILFPAIVSPNGKNIYERWKFFEIK